MLAVSETLQIQNEPKQTFTGRVRRGTQVPVHPLLLQGETKGHAKKPSQTQTQSILVLNFLRLKTSWFDRFFFTALVFLLTEEGRYACVRCGSSYKNKKHLKSHIAYECGVERRFVCLGCQKKFKHRKHLNRHLTTRVCQRIPLFLKNDNQ